MQIWYKSKKMVIFPDRNSNILGRWIDAETVSHLLVIPYKVDIANIRYGTNIAREGQATTGHLLLPQLDT